MRIILAVTGASGSIYARQLVDALVARDVEIGIILTANASDVITYERENRLLNDRRITYYGNDDFFTPPASGSSQIDAMVVVPCSMGTLGRVASGVSEDLVGRSADVMLKERRKLILVTRETPLNLIHLRNMVAVTEAGAIVLPASPSFYGHPSDIEQLCATVTDRILMLLGLVPDGHAWCE